MTCSAADTDAAHIGEIADTCEAATEAAITATEFADIGEAATATEAVDKGEAEPVYTSEAATKSAVTVVSKPVITDPAPSTPDVGVSASTVPGMGETEDERKGVERAARVKLMWERFWARMSSPSPQGEYPESRKYYHLVRQRVKSVLAYTASKKSKCLNSTSRAIMLKQTIATLLSVPGQASTWSCLPDVEQDTVNKEMT